MLVFVGRIVTVNRALVVTIKADFYWEYFRSRMKKQKKKLKSNYHVYLKIRYKEFLKTVFLKLRKFRWS